MDVNGFSDPYVKTWEDSVLTGVSGWFNVDPVLFEQRENISAQVKKMIRNTDESKRQDKNRKPGEMES